MFEKIVRNVARKSSTPKVELTSTAEFLTVVADNGCRLSYAALAQAARIFGEDSSTQIPAQRGASLVKALPVNLQPFVCRKSGTYGKGVLAKFDNLPEDLEDRPVITLDVVGKAIKEVEASKK